PFEFAREDGQMDGMCIELARWISTEAGFQVRFLNMSFEQAQKAVLSGRADIITSLFYSHKRAESFGFSDTIFEVPASIFVKAERPDISRLDHLKGKRIAIQRGDYAKEFLESKGIPFELIPTDSFAEATDAVLSDRADALIGDEQIVLYHLFSNKLTKLAKKVGEPLYIGKNGMATRVADPLLLSILKKSMIHARECGVLDKISKKWLGTNYQEEKISLESYLPYLLPAIAVILSLVLAIIYWNMKLRQQVEIRTRELAEEKEHLLTAEAILQEQNEALLLSQEALHDQNDELLATEEMLRVQLDAVEESSQKFRAVFEYSPIAIALTNKLDGCFSEINQGFIDMFGYSKEETIGKTTLELGVWANEKDYNRYLQMLTEDRCVRNFESQMLNRGGDELTLFFTATFLEINGHPFLLNTMMDISEQKRLQKEINQTQKMDAIGQLAGGIAHDFNNMLAGIVAAAEILKLRMDADDDKLKMVEIIIEAAGRSADLTRELLTFSRKGSGNITPVRVHETIVTVIKLLERTIDKQINIETSLEADNPIVMGDQTQLQNTLLNLSINARDAMHDGGTLTFSTAVKMLGEADCLSMGISLPSAGYLEIAVADTGSGMTKTVMDHIFEPFFTTKEVGKGTGLGLAAVYGTVMRHNGAVYVESEPGLGSIFKIYIPLIEEENLQISAGDDEQVILGSGGVLLVDDEELLRDIGSELLKSLGYKVYLAENGLKALEVFAAHRGEISIVMLDMIMPVMGGQEAFIRLRELDPTLRILFCSGFNADWSKEELLKLGSNGFIQKPYNRNELSRALAKAIGGAIRFSSP
ncbi:MAG: transporter substrate-binding domain-containing protein, partial [Desulfuromonadaceae bacterium]|nr:transporter substrate-binding domain-containing protein [Desulfuromonadaceae bacterium]